LNDSRVVQSLLIHWINIPAVAGTRSTSLDLLVLQVVVFYLRCS
jgi:hypothetical protein